MRDKIKQTYPTRRKIGFALCFIWQVSQIPQDYEACVDLMVTLVERAQAAGEGVLRA